MKSRWKLSDGRTVVRLLIPGLDNSLVIVDGSGEKKWTSNPGAGFSAFQGEDRHRGRFRKRKKTLPEAVAVGSVQSELPL